jgi:hydrogenase large subunit
MSRLVIDPVTRVGGQLRVEAEVVSGAVAGALVSGTMLRGIETVLKGRDPRDVWLLAQRICGTCTGVHALASVRAVEKALGIEIPTNARLVRNIMAGTLLVRDHVTVFYQRALPDWVDVTAATKADPLRTSALAHATSAWPKAGTGYFGEVRDRLAALVASGQPGPFGGWSGHPAYRLSPEQNLMLAAHMLDALDWQRKFLRIEALFGGKDPHAQSYLVGGLTLTPPWGGPAASRTRQHPQVPDRNSPIALSNEGLDLVTGLVGEAVAFIDGAYLPDIRLLAAAYPEYTGIGAGPGNFLAFGDYPEDATRDPVMFLPGGRLVAGNLEQSLPVDQARIAETVKHAWYAADAGGLRPPAEGELVPEFTAQVPLTQLDERGPYSWVKAPRYDGIAMETGPLARMLVGAADGRTEIRVALGQMLEATGIRPDALASAMGRMIARAVEAQVVAKQLGTWVSDLRSNLAGGDLAVANVEFWDPVSWPDEADGWSLGEGPRGAVGHWMGIKNASVDRYQVIDGSTWNASPRDEIDLPGPLEVALAGVAVADAAQPIEMLRVIHSIAPCAACAAHAVAGRPGSSREIHIHAMEASR